MLTFFTTWNICLFMCSHIRKKHSRALLSLSSGVSFAGLLMLCSMNHNKKNLLWKKYKVNKYAYYALECIIHQIPLYIAIKLPMAGNAFHSFVPASIYCCIISNPYKLKNINIRNYHGLCLLGITSPIVNYLTNYKSKST